MLPVKTAIFSFAACGRSVISNMNSSGRLMIKKIDPTLETAFFMTDGRYSYLSSTGVRELAYFNGDVSQMVPPYVEANDREKIKVT